MDRIPYGKQNITSDDIEAVIQALQSDFLTQGPKILEFEQKFASYVGAEYAVAVSNGTAALHLSCIAMGLSEGQKVITSPITFAASANCARYCGAQVDFVDIDPNTYLIDLDLLADKLDKSKKGEYSGIIAVDFSGLPIDTKKLHYLAQKHDLWVIEDACHAPGGYFKTNDGNIHKCGESVFSDLTCFSFHPVKHIACGEGGMITTNDPSVYENLLELRTHGITKDPDRIESDQGNWYYEMQQLGYNYRLPDLNAALGSSQLDLADKRLQKRFEIAQIYSESFQAIDEITLQVQPKNFQNAYHLYIIEVNDRKGLYDHLRANNIYCQIHYIPVHLLPYYKQLGWKKGDFPASESYYDRCISLPMYPTLTREEQNYVIEQVISYVSNSH